MKFNEYWLEKHRLQYKHNRERALKGITGRDVVTTHVWSTITPLYKPTDVRRVDGVAEEVLREQRGRVVELVLRVPVDQLRAGPHAFVAFFDRANFTGLVLGCIAAKFCKKICVWKLSPRSTQCSPLHSSVISIFCQFFVKNLLKRLLTFARFSKIRKFLKNFAIFWQKYRVF